MVSLPAAASEVAQRGKVPTEQSNHQPTIAIAAQGIDKVFASRTEPFQALNAVDLQVEAGTVHLLMGPNGAGKTTLLLILAGLMMPTAGEVILLGQCLQRLSRQELDQFRLHHMGIVFQDHNLLRALTALENVEVALQFKGIHGREARQQAEALLEAVGLSNKANLPARVLSIGQQQRVGIARAMTGDPALMIADEPTSALDSQNGRMVGNLFRQLADQKGSTVLVATHDYRLIPFADLISYLEDGTVVRVEDRRSLSESGTVEQATPGRKVLAE